ncbi:hypothetical protein F5Y02DRAFT_422525 [Annulohypoxylon stygium]|nr:hypothetical protein F5Y02DRAFT_422525 [Annulohypoxylon stygium]
MMYTLILSIGLPALVFMMAFWDVWLNSMLQAYLFFIQHPVSGHLVSLSFVCIALYSSMPILEFLTVLASSLALKEAGSWFDNFLWFTFVVFVCFILYVEFWKYIGDGILKIMNYNLKFFLRTYRWRRFVHDCTCDGKRTLEFRVATYICDQVHYLVVGPWKVAVIKDFRARNFHAPMPVVYEQLQLIFMGEFDSMLATRTRSIIVNDIFDLARGASYY